MNADNKIYSKNIITGKLYYYGICVPQDTGYGEPQANYTAPSTSATPVKCPHNNVVETCSEGYCAMFQYQNLYSNDSEETKGSFQSCPNIIINELYVLQKSEVSTWNYQFYDSLYQAAQLCIDQKSLTMLSKNEDYTFFWSIECYIPTTEESSPTFPPIPDLNFYATTKMISVSTTGSSSTTLSSSVGPSSSEIPTTLISTSTTLRPSTSVRPSTTLIPTTLISTSTTSRPSTSVRPSTTLITSTIIPTTSILTSTVISPSTTLHTSTSVKPTTLIVSTIIPTTSNPTSTISPSTTINSQTTLNPSSTSVNIQTTSDIMSTTQSSPTITTSSTTTVHQTSTSNSPSTSISTTTQNIPTTTQINLTTVNSSSTSVSATTENIPTTTQQISSTTMNASSTSISATTQITSTSVSTTTLNSSSSTQTYDHSTTQSIMTSTELNDDVELIVISTTETVSSTNQNIITTTKGGKSNTIISFNTNTFRPCTNVADKCVYVSLSAPELAIGTISGCASDVGTILEKIFYQRIDVKDTMIQYYDPITHQFDINKFCNIAGNGSKIYTELIINGVFNYYGICVPQGSSYGLKLANFVPPSASATPVLCPVGNTSEICYEGYCSMFDYVTLYENVNAEEHYAYEYCPNLMYNRIYKTMISNNTWNSEFKFSLLEAGRLCANKTGSDTLSVHGQMTYYWFVNCYVPSKNNVFPTFPPLPDITVYATTTIGPQTRVLITSPTQQRECNNVTDNCVYISLSIPGLSVGTLSGCSTNISSTMTTIINQRLDIIDVFSPFSNNVTKEFDAKKFCAQVTNKNMIYNAQVLTGNMSYYGECVNQGEIFYPPLANFTAPTTSVTPVQCPSDNTTETCSEGYCGMLEYADLTPVIDGQYHEAFRYCPTFLINMIYIVSTQASDIWNPNLRYGLQQTPKLCIDRLSTRTLTKMESQLGICKDIDDNCVYVSLNIPGLSVGTFSGCSSNVSLILQTIIEQRLDVKDAMIQFFSDMSRKFDTRKLCDQVTNYKKIHTLEVITGNMSYYGECVKDGQEFSPPLANFTAPTSPATPVQCPFKNETYYCSEGYCGMLEYADLTPDGEGQFQNQLRSCPTTIINQIYKTSTSKYYIWNNQLKSNMPFAAKKCINQSTLNFLSKNGRSSFYIYTNCYIPEKDVIPQFPAIPDLYQYTTTIGSTYHPFTIITKRSTIETTTKGTISNIHMSIVTFIFVILSFLFF
uniref:GPS domain-containing protein n=1 Tax=Parastrongyloides trichosuri TaxID=131310 RepID=A0A0N4ZAN0_PARTI